MKPKKVFIPFSEEDVMRDAMHLIRHLRIEYLYKYHTEPQFVKIPVWLYNLFVNDYESRISEYPPPDLRGCPLERKVAKLRGLTVCPTISISGITEIEVL